MSIKVLLRISFLLAAISLFSLPSRAATSCVNATGASSGQSRSCNVVVSAGDKVIMGVVAASSSFCLTETAGASVSTLTCQIFVHAGDTVIMAGGFGVQHPTFSSTTPTATWNPTRSQQLNSSGFWLAAADTTAGSSGTMTCSVNQGSGFTFWAMLCYDVGPLGAIDAQNSATGSSSTATTSVVTTQASDQLVVINGQNGAASFINPGFVMQRFGPNAGVGVADKLAGASGTYTETNAASSGSWATMMFAYKTTTTPVQNLPTFSSTPAQSWTTQMSQNGSGDSSSHVGTGQISLADTVASASGTMTCTADLGAPFAFWSMYCLDVGPLGAVDGTSGATGTSGTATTSVTSTQANDWYISLSQLSGGAYSINTGYTTVQSDVTFSGGLLADQLFVAAGAHSASASRTATGWTIGLVAYQPFTGTTLLKHKSVLF